MKSDDIRVFLPGISEPEYLQRAKLRTLRNAASAMIANTDSETARELAWTCSQYASAFIYAGASEATLGEVVHFCHRLMITAMQAEHLDHERAHNEH